MDWDASRSETREFRQAKREEPHRTAASLERGEMARRGAAIAPDRVNDAASKRPVTALHRYAYALALAALAGLLWVTLRYTVIANPVPLFLLAIAAAAWLGGRGPGLLATLLGTLCAVFSPAASGHPVALGDLRGLTPDLAILVLGMVVTQVVYLVRGRRT